MDQLKVNLNVVQVVRRLQALRDDQPVGPKNLIIDLAINFIASVH